MARNSFADLSIYEEAMKSDDPMMFIADKDNNGDVKKVYSDIIIKPRAELLNSYYRSTISETV